MGLACELYATAKAYPHAMNSNTCVSLSLRLHRRRYRLKKKKTNVSKLFLYNTIANRINCSRGLATGAPVLHNHYPEPADRVSTASKNKS